MNIGDALAHARRQGGLTITEVSQATRVKETIIRDIEQNDSAPAAVISTPGATSVASRVS
jgi:cytoskeletal protein RodZ